MSAALSLYCRFCAEQKLVHELTDVKSNQDLHREIMEKLSIFSSIPVDFTRTTFPETVCSQCMQMLNSTHEFYTKMEASQTVLTELFSSKIEPGLTENNDNSSDCSDYYYLTKEENAEIKLELDKNSEPFEQSYEECSTSENAWSFYPWACKHCDIKVESSSALREHSKESHDLCFAFKCADCEDNFFQNFEDFVDHVKQHRNKLSQFCHHCDIELKPDSTEHITAHNIQPHCFICGEFFADNYVLHSHLTKYQKDGKYDVSWTDYEWICRECGVKLTDQDSLRVHLKEVHKTCFGMQCADCPEKVDSFNAFVDHVTGHKPSLSYYCQYCNFKFLEAQQTINHLSEHLFNQCQICGESLPSPKALRAHAKTYALKKQRAKKRRGGEKDLTCDVCHKVAKSSSNLQMHRMVHTERRRNYTCERCGKTFFTKGALTEHRVVHEKKNTEVCKICKKAFLTVTRLKKHVQTHYAVKNFICDICQRGFRLKEQIKNHMACHSDTAPYSCKYCEKAFRYRNVLKIHENQHTGARPYTCSFCNMDFANWSNCNKHMLRKHGATLAKSAMTPQGRLDLSPSTGQPTPVMDLAQVKDWVEKILKPRRRGKKKL